MGCFMTVRFFHFLTVLFLVFFAGAAYAGDAASAVAAKPGGTGLEGRAVWQGQVLAGARVYAYKSFGEMRAFQPVAVSDPTGDDGAYRMDLPAGRYYLAVKKRAAEGDGPLEEGDYYCFHGSNPITVAGGARSHVGFSTVRKAGPVAYEEAPDPGSGTLAGAVTYMGAPLEGAYVTLYLDAKDDFKGMGYSASPPTGKDGVFRLDLLPESDYYVIARKRASGTNAGPLADGDYFGYYAGNPVSVRAGKSGRIAFEVVSKAGEIGKDDSLFRDTGTKITGRITGPDGHAAKGVYAFAYEEKVMAHKRPSFISREVDEGGNYTINLSAGGTYYIGARSSYGDSPGIGEWYGRYDKTPDHSVTVKTGERTGGVDMAVEKILP